MAQGRPRCTRTANGPRRTANGNPRWTYLPGSAKGFHWMRIKILRNLLIQMALELLSGPNSGLQHVLLRIFDMPLPPTMYGRLVFGRTVKLHFLITNQGGLPPCGCMCWLLRAWGGGLPPAVVAVTWGGLPPTCCTSRPLTCGKLPVRRRSLEGFTPPSCTS